MNIELTLSIIATTLAVASFCGQAWRVWRDRPRLTFYVSPVTFTNVPKFGELKMLRLMICNIGYRPIVLTRFMAFGETSAFSMGIDDEPAAIFGKDDQRFPALIGSGETLKIHPITVSALERNMTKPEDERVHFDPYKYFGVIDSFGRIHPIDADDVRWHLGIVKTRQRPKGWKKPARWIAKKRFLRKVRRRLKRDIL